jgi:lipopolysaccharide biosynthesis glycosyltransferase
MMNILLAFDRNVVGPVAACLKSLAITNPDENIVVHLIHSPLPSEDETKLRNFIDELGFKCRFIPIDSTLPEELHRNLPRSILPAATLFRCFLERYVPDEIGRLLYLDSDTLVLGSLRSLYETELGEHVAGVVHNCGPDEEIGTHLVDLGVARDDYFNAGVMLVDLEKWRSRGIERQLLATFQTDGRKLKYHDQCALNIVLHGGVVYLPRKYNYRPELLWRTPDFEIPVIIHYAHIPKPWNYPGGPWGGLYTEIAGMTPWPVSDQLLREIGVPRLRVHKRRILRALRLRK